MREMIDQSLRERDLPKNEVDVGLNGVHRVMFCEALIEP